MPRKKIRESLTARVFLITAGILLCAGTVTFGLIAWATPSAYITVLSDDLAGQVEALAEDLESAPPEDWGALLDAFIRSSGADAALAGPDGELLDTGSQLAMEPPEAEAGTIAAFEAESSITYAAEAAAEGESVTLTMAERAAVTAAVRLEGQSGLCSLYVTPRGRTENLAARALVQMAPWLLLALVVFSLLCAFVYSRYITRPIVRLSAIAGKMAELELDWTCDEARQDEIGRLGRSLDQMARKLSAALGELKASNEALRGEVERERELDRQRTAFFSAASHELKTPVTILKGQLTGMLDGVGVYRDREKYLARALQVTGRMEGLIQELLTISRVEARDAAFPREAVDLSQLVRRRLELDGDLLRQRGLRLSMALCPGLTVEGDPSLLAKAVGSLLSNAALYTPAGGEIRVWSGMAEGRPALTVENTGVHISQEALPHIFEAFYREEGSRNRATGGSGLGLCLARAILDRHGASCAVENTAEGVRATVRFEA